MHKLTPLLAIPFALLLVHCSDVQPECGVGQVVDESGQCMNIPCDGGEVMGSVCVCPGDEVLDAGRCIDPEDPCLGKDCDDQNECTTDACNAKGECVYENVPDRTDCDAGDGVCISGACVEDTPCAGVDCSSENECIGDGTCNPENGSCIPGANEPLDTACTADGGSFCDGAGACAQCNDNAQCTDDDPNNPCTRVDCQSNQCQQVFTGELCVFPPDLPGICEEGACIDAGLCDPFPVCEDRGDCVEVGCNPADGKCTYGNKEDGTSCTPDGAPDGTCTAGVCDPGPPQVVSFLPTGNDVEPDATITAEFDRAMNGDTIDGTTFTLETSNGPVLGIVTYDALTQTATFTPDTPRRRLTLNVLHTAKLSAIIQDTAGRALASDEEVGFRVRDGEWSQPVRIDNSSASAQYARVSASADGHAVVVWSQAGVYWVRLKPSGERSSAALLALSSVAYDVGMDNEGNAIVIHGGASSDPVVGQRLLADQSNWSGANQLSSSCNSAGTARIALTPAGRALAVWSDSVGGKLCGAAFTGTDWQPAEDLDSGSSTSIGRPDVAVAPDGRGFAVWSHEFSTSDSRVMARRYTGSAWAGSATRLDDSGEANGPAIAVDSDGNAMAGWQDTRRSSDNLPTHINYRRYVEDQGDWLPVVGRVDNSGATNFDTQVAADAAGNFVFLWGEAAANMRARLWRAADGNLAGVEQITGTGSFARDPHMVLEPNGTGLAMWYREDGAYMGSRFRPGVGDWEEFGEEEIDSVMMDQARDPFRPRIAIRPDGTAVAAWAYFFDLFLTEFE